MQVNNYYFNEENVQNVKVENHSNDSLILIFGNNLELFKNVLTKFNSKNIVGCSSSGEIINEELLENGISITVIDFKDTKVKTTLVPFKDYDDSFASGEKVMNNLNQEDLKGVLLFSEGLNINGAKLIEGLESKNNHAAVIGGGTAGDYLEFNETWVYHNGEKVNNAIVAVGLYGKNLNLSFGSSSGIKALGVEKKITKASKNVLYTIDNKRAFDIYSEWFKGFGIHDFEELLLQCPVEISKNFQTEDGLVRTPISYNKEDGSITFTGEIPEGKYLRMMRADINEMIDASNEAVQKSMARLNQDDSNNVLNLIVSCSARKALLGTETEDELIEANMVSEKFKAKQVGFYSYGEFTNVNNKSEFVNQTMTVISIEEKKAA